MNLQKAIKKVRENIRDSIQNNKPFYMIGCGKRSQCTCVSGIKWDESTLDSGRIIMKNGHVFKLSVDLGNALEWEFAPLIQPHRINQTWENRNLAGKIRMI